MIITFKNLLSQWISPSLVNQISDDDQKLIRKMLSELDHARQFQHPMSIPLKDIPFVVFDLETTGFDPSAGDEIIEIGAVIVENGKISEHVFHHLVNPERPIPPVVSELTGITDDSVKGKPNILPVLASFLTYIRHYYLVAHCASFDLGFLNKKLRKYTKRTLPNRVLDTADLAMMIDHRPTSSLDELLEAYNIPQTERHTALGDARLTAQLFILLLEELSERKVTTLRDLHYFTRNNKIMLREKGLI